MSARAVWLWWWLMLAAPVGVLALRWWALGPMEPAKWSVGTILVTSAAGLWLLVAAPAAVVLRGHCFRDAWRGRAVDPRSYRRGMVTVWGALEGAAMLGTLGAAATGAWLPCVVPAAVGVMLIGVLWPTPRAVA